MFERDHGSRAKRAGGILLYAGLTGLFIAISFVMSGRSGQSATGYVALDPELITAIEFVTTTSAALRGSLNKSCTATGCDAGTLHPMITASAAAMDERELQDALDSQLRILAESAALRNAMRPESDAYRVANADWETASRIVDLYRAELRLR